MQKLYITLIGVMLIILGFYLLVDIHPWPNMIKLDLGVAILVFLVNMANLRVLGQPVSNFQKNIPSLGVLWVADISYSAGALGWIYVVHSRMLSLEWAVMGQLALLFMLALWIIVAIGANKHANQVQATEAKFLNSMDQLRLYFDRQSYLAEALREKHPDLYKRYQQLHDDLRYLVPTNAQDAASLEEEIRREGAVLFSMLPSLDSSGAYSAAITATLDRLQNAIRFRKDNKHLGDYQEFLK